jgi:hypothetical protein
MAIGKNTYFSVCRRGSPPTVVGNALTVIEAVQREVEAQIAAILATRPETAVLTVQIGVGLLTAAAVLASLPAPTALSATASPLPAAGGAPTNGPLRRLVRACLARQTNQIATLCVGIGRRSHGDILPAFYGQSPKIGVSWHDVCDTQRRMTTSGLRTPRRPKAGLENSFVKGLTGRHQSSTFVLGK